MSPRRMLAVAVLLPALLLPALLQAQPCPPGSLGAIPNFSLTKAFDGNVILRWDPVTGTAGIVPQYEVVEQRSTDPCGVFSPQNVIATTTATSFTFKPGQSNSFYLYFVRLAQDRCKATQFSLLFDTFTTPPAKPAILSAVAGPASVTVTFSYSDPKAFDVVLDRAGGNGGFTFVDLSKACPRGSIVTIEDRGVPRAATGMLTPGIYAYRLRVFYYSGGVNVTSDVVTVTVGNPAPEIVSFTATPSKIRRGGTSTLTYHTRNAVSVSIDNGVTAPGVRGSVTVSPTDTTTYTLTAAGPGGATTTERVTVEVIAKAAIIATRLPAGLLQPAGTGGATDRYTLTNLGGAATTITLTQSAPPFFTQSPASFTIAPGTSQEITLAGIAQAAGFMEGSSIATGEGINGELRVIVRLLSVVPFVGTVIPRAQIRRIDTTQQTGAIRFTNAGTAPLVGILVSEVAWIIPQPGLITIPPGGEATVTFTIDRSKRPDGDSPSGSVKGALSLVFIRSATPGVTAEMIRPLNGATSTGSTTVTVVDLAVPVTSIATVPALASGEIAIVVPGLTRKEGIVTDLTVYNSNPGTVGDLRLFYSTSGSSSPFAQLASVKPLASTQPVSFDDVVKGVFQADNQAGGAQVRTQASARVTVTAALVSSPEATLGTYAGTLASFRSDRGAAPNATITLTGLKKESGMHTELFLQEMSGLASLVRTELFDEGGASRGTRTDPLASFAMLELDDVVPAGAVSATVTNVSVTDSRITAHALVLDERTGDSANVVDWNRRNGTSATEDQLIPLATRSTLGERTTRTDVAITNRGGDTATGTLTFYGGTGRRRGVARSTGTAGAGTITAMASDRAISIGPGQTRLLSDVMGTTFGVGTASGYLLYTPTTGEVALTSRTYTSGSEGTYGTSVPVTASSAAMRSGQTQTFANLSDASTESVTNRKSGTYRMTLGLIEAAGQTVTVKATLRSQILIPGGLASAPLSAAKEYTLAPRQSIVIPDLARAIFGAGRDTLGDIQEMQLEVAVTGGEGGVVAYTLATENATDDTALRME